MAFLPGAFGVVVLLLHDLCHEAAHGFRGLVLHLPSSVRVGAEGKACAIVASILEIVLMSTPFWKASVAKVCLRSQKRMCSSPA